MKIMILISLIFMCGISNAEVKPAAAAVPKAAPVPGPYTLPRLVTMSQGGTLYKYEDPKDGIVCYVVMGVSSGTAMQCFKK